MQARTGRRGAARTLFVAEELECRRMLALTAPALSSLPGAPRSIYLDFVGAQPFGWSDSNGNSYTVHGPGGE
jgi:hypothetical protein